MVDVLDLLDADELREFVREEWRMRQELSDEIQHQNALRLDTALKTGAKMQELRGEVDGMRRVTDKVLLEFDHRDEDDLDYRASFEECIEDLRRARHFSVFPLSPAPVSREVVETTEPRKKSLEIRIDGDQLQISIGIDTLCFAVEVGLNADLEKVKWAITDNDLFVKSIMRRLEDEEEDGTTPIHRTLDTAARKALEQGDEGIEAIPVSREVVGDGED